MVVDAELAFFINLTQINRMKTNRCPNCGKINRSDAAKCSYCGAWLSPASDAARPGNSADSRRSGHAVANICITVMALAALVVAVACVWSTHSSGNEVDSIVTDGADALTEAQLYGIPDSVADTDSLPSLQLNKTVEGFYVYDDMLRYQVPVNYIPTSFEIYENEKSQLSHFVLGSWATNGFPQVGDYIAPGISIARITYTSKNRVICSGYSSNGKVFYMKTVIDDSGAVDQVWVLCLLHKEADRDANKQLTLMVRDWKPKKIDPFD